MKITALLTCHNRRAGTLECLRCLHACTLPDGYSLHVFLVDDGSSDGTSDAVRLAFPDVTLLPGDGNLFWCGGMRMAWRHAAGCDPDYYLCLNDDTFLTEDALASLLQLVPAPGDRVIGVGAIQELGREDVAYGGWLDGFPMPLTPTGEPQECDTCNANCLLVPRAVFTELGIFHHAYTHGLGDVDYGYQAARKGIKLLLTASFVGSCAKNGKEGTWQDVSLPRMRRFTLLESPKGFPWLERIAYCRRNSGKLWPWRVVSPLVRILIGR